MKKLLLLFIISSFSTALFSQNDIRANIDPLLYPFYHGVASGDPLSDRVILWTRVTDDTLTVDSVQVDWRIATDTNMNNVINSGTGYAKASKDWTYKVDASGLQPNTWYYYDFNGLGRYSLRGRTKTAPTGDIDSVRFAVVSCSNWEHGYFHAYKHLKDRNDFDCVLHLGDYIYEYETGGFSANLSDRINEPTHEIITLEDYRLRYSHYKLDSDLRDLHQQFPFINIWDDHETANDSYIDGAANHDPGTEGLWSDRKAGATQAYHEWLPIRSPNAGNTQIYRKFAWGDLIDLHMLDTRLEARVLQDGGATNDPNRPLLGPTQLNWLTNNLQTSTARWNILGQQVMMAPLENGFGGILNADQWDGYANERDQLYNSITTNNIENLVVLTGDIHTSWVNDIPLGNYDQATCTGSLGVEFVVTSVTSTSFLTFDAAWLIQVANPHNQYVETSKRGYMILDVNKTRIQGDYYYMNDVEVPTPGEYYATSYYVNDTEKCANEAITFSSNPGPLPIYAPQYPIGAPLGIETVENLVVFGAYPNPVIDEVTVQFYLYQAENVNVKLYDISGKLVFNDIASNLNKGVNYMKLNLQSLKAGAYSLVLETNFHRATKTLIKVQ